jgi:hypothetical protein
LVFSDFTAVLSGSTAAAVFRQSVARLKSLPAMFAMNSAFHDAVLARIDGEFPANIYKRGDDDEILGLEMFGYVTMVSKTKN